VGGLALTKGIDARLLADTSPCAMKRTVQPEARLVAEHHHAAAGSGLLIAGRRSRTSQPLARTLDREPELVQQPGHVVVVVPNAEAALDERPGSNAP
jgi:hypothetical protein